MGLHITSMTLFSIAFLASFVGQTLAASKTPLIDAVKKKSATTNSVELVLRNGGNPDEKDSKGTSAIVYAADRYGCLAPITRLLLGRISVSLSIPPKHPCLGAWLNAAAQSNNLQTVNDLLLMGAPTEFRETLSSKPVNISFSAGAATSTYSGSVAYDGPLALEYGADNSNLEMIKLLLTHGADYKPINLGNSCNISILHFFFDSKMIPKYTSSCAYKAIERQDVDLLIFWLTAVRPAIYDDMISKAEKIGNADIIGILVSQIRETRKRLLAAITGNDVATVKQFLDSDHHALVLPSDIELASQMGNAVLVNLLEKETNKENVALAVKYGIK
jgi:ankyrin repeat protein